MDDPMAIDVTSLREGVVGMVCRWQSLEPVIISDEEFDLFHDNGAKLMKLLSEIRTSPYGGPWLDELWKRMESGWNALIARWSARAAGIAD